MFTPAYVALALLREKNLRHIYDEAELSLLGDSLLITQWQPIVIGPLIDGFHTVYDGNRRARAAKMKGLTHLDAVQSDKEIDDAELCQGQLIASMHNVHLSLYEQFTGCLGWLQSKPGATMKDLAKAISRDPALITRLLSLNKCLPEVKEAAKAGKIGLSQWYQISQSADQLAALAMALTGATREQLAQANKAAPSGPPAEKTPKIKIPMASGIVTVAGEKGGEIDYDGGEALLKEAIKALRTAKENNWSLKSAQNAWRDMASA